VLKNKPETKTLISFYKRFDFIGVKQRTTRGFFIFVQLLKMKKKILIRFLLFILIASVVYGCGLERKLAINFTKNEVPGYTLLLGPEFVYKSNLKKEILDSLGIKDSTLFDSVLMANSTLVQYVDDSMFIANYLLGYQKELKVFGFKVFREDASDAFFDIDSNAFIINVAQLEIEESNYTQRDDISLYDTYYYHDHVLDAATVSSWIEVNKINPDIKEKHVYFASDMITDDLQGEFLYDYFSEKIKYVYEIDTLKYTDLYDFAYRLGRTYAGYTYDLILNNYLKKNVPEDKLSGKYWRYNPELKNLFYATEDKFIPLDQ
jgi:hypothetical protein